MAYKFQLGTAVLGGGLTIRSNDMTAEGEITGSNMSGTLGMKAGGMVSFGAGILVRSNDGRGLYINDSGNGDEDGARFIAKHRQEGSNYYGMVQLKDSSGRMNVDLGLSDTGGREGEGFVNLYDADDKKIYIEGSGELSSSVAFNAGGTLTGNANMTVDGDLTVNGTLFDVTTNEISMDDPVFQINSGADTTLANNISSGFQLGDGSGAYGAKVVYKNNATYGGRHLEIALGDDSAMMPAEAAKLFGSAAGLESVPNADPIFTISTLADSGTVAEGCNVVADRDGASQHVSASLPVGAVGSFYQIVASNLENDAAIHIDLATGKTVDGATSFKIQSPYGSAALIYDGSSWHFV